MSGTLHLIVPGPLDQRTGGYLYDARVARGLRRRGWAVSVHELEGRFPGPGATAEASLDRTLGQLPDGARAVVDGLALGGHPAPVQRHAGRLRILALVHHPVSDEYGVEDRRKRRLARLEREAWRAASGAVVTSRFTAARLQELGVPADRIRVVVPGTAPAPPADGPGPGEPPRLLCVGSLIPRKGQDVLVRALSRLEHLEWTCVFAGSLERERSYAGTVRRLAAAAGLSDRLRFTGECERHTLEELYRTTSLFVLPSRYEGYGMALAEAMARGLPVVSTTGGAIPGTVPSDAARLVPPGDERALARALEGLLANGGEPESEGEAPAERRKRLGAAARRHARTLPDWPETAEAFAAAVLELAPEGAATG